MVLRATSNTPRGNVTTTVTYAKTGSSDLGPRKELSTPPKAVKRHSLAADELSETAHAGGRESMRIEANQQDMFRRIDANGDNKITKDEMKANAPQAGPPPDGAPRPVGDRASRPPSLDELFSRIDADGDGGISMDEHDAFMQARGAERHVPRDPAAIATDLFRKADSDGDGTITKTELAAVLPQGTDGSLIDKLFAEADGDEDGSITESELKTSIEKRVQTGPGYDASGQATVLTEPPATHSFLA